MGRGIKRVVGAEKEKEREREREREKERERERAVMSTWREGGRGKRGRE